MDIFVLSDDILFFEPIKIRTFWYLMEIWEMYSCLFITQQGVYTWVVMRNRPPHYHRPSYLPKHSHLLHPHRHLSNLSKIFIMGQRNPFVLCKIKTYFYRMKKAILRLVTEKWLVTPIQNSLVGWAITRIMFHIIITYSTVVIYLPSAGNSSNSSSSSNKPKSGFFSFSLPSLMLIIRGQMNAYSIKRFKVL